MASYISSTNNRLYATREAEYGIVPVVSAQDRCAFTQFRATQTVTVGQRRDKTGSRSNLGSGQQLREENTFALKAYVTGAEGPTGDPTYGALVESATGGTPLRSSGQTTAAGSTASVIHFSSPHAMVPGQSIAFGNALRFVAAVPSSTSVQLSAPLASAPNPGTVAGASVTYTLADRLPSVSIFDYWDPSNAVQRILRGGGVDVLELKINGDYHELTFSGVAAAILDNVTFEHGQGGLEAFPAEPALEAWQTNPTPGHLGEIWLGAEPKKFCTVTEGMVRIDNGLETRNSEFGCFRPKALVPGPRMVECSFSLYERDDEETQALYQAAKNRLPISLTLQLGTQAGQLCAVFVKSFVPELPAFDDTEARLKWRFDASRAQGTSNDEIYIAFA